MIGGKDNWNDKNSLRNYPFEPIGVLFPTSLIIDAFICIRAEGVKPCVSLINVRDSMVSILFSDENTGEDIFACVRHKNQEGKSNLDICGSHDVSGYIEFGEVSNLKRGLFRYNMGDVRLLNHCFLCVGENTVRSASSSLDNEKIKKDLSLNFVRGFEIDLLESSEPLIGEKTIITVSLSNPERFIDECYPPETICDCEEKPIKQINSVPPDPTTKNITIQSPLDIVSVVNGPGEVSIGVLKSSNTVCPSTNLPSPGGKLRGES